MSSPSLGGIGYTWDIMADTQSAPLDGHLAAFVAGERGRYGDAGRQHALIDLLHRLADGLPVAANAALDTTADLPPAWLETCEDGYIVGFGGLTQNATRHCIDIDGRALFAWCAFDCLFLPGLLGRTVAGQSTCPTTDAPIRLTVSPDGIESHDPATTVMSFVIPDETARRENLRQVFCAHINFFADRGAADNWLAAAGEGWVLDLETAFTLARRRNEAAFDAVLGS
jgi:alkylmercury lyase